MQDITALSTEQLVERFATLPCPTIDELDGEYDAKLLRQPNLPAALSGRLAVDNPLSPWQAKAFRPVDEETGRGYNTFRRLGRTVQRYPMHTMIAPSRFDGLPAYQLIYRAYESLCGTINMVDEVRRIADGTYLGIGTWGFTDAQRAIALPFLLEGPVRPYRRDIGSPRTDFTITRRELPGLTAGDRR